MESEGSQGYTENQLSNIIFDCTLRVHRALGTGLLESSYEECLFYELLRQDYRGSVVKVVGSAINIFFCDASRMTITDRVSFP